MLFTLSSAEGLRECVRAGLGLTILPRGYLSAGRTRDLRAVRLSHPTPRRTVWLVRRAANGMPTPLVADAFALALREAVGQAGPARAATRVRRR